MSSYADRKDMDAICAMSSQVELVGDIIHFPVLIDKTFPYKEEEPTSRETRSKWLRVIASCTVYLKRKEVKAPFRGKRGQGSWLVSQVLKKIGKPKMRQRSEASRTINGFIAATTPILLFVLTTHFSTRLSKRSIYCLFILKIYCRKTVESVAGLRGEILSFWFPFLTKWRVLAPCGAVSCRFSLLFCFLFFSSFNLDLVGFSNANAWSLRCVILHKSFRGSYGNEDYG